MVSSDWSGWKPKMQQWNGDILVSHPGFLLLIHYFGVKREQIVLQLVSIVSGHLKSSQTIWDCYHESCFVLLIASLSAGHSSNMILKVRI